MIWITTKRIIKAGFVNFWRNGIVSFSAVFVMSIALFIITATLLTAAFFGTALKDLQGKVDINIYIETTAQESSILDLQSTLEKLPEVKTVSYFSREKVLEVFKKRHSGDYRILRSLEMIGENPLLAVLTVKAREPSQYEGIAAFLENKLELSTKAMLSIVNKVDYVDNKDKIERLNNLIIGTKKLGSIFTIVMIMISVLITFNTIRLAIFTSREEIAVMRMVGGSNEYIRGPFVIEGILYGLMSGFLTLILFYPITYWLKNITKGFYGGIDLLHYFVANFVEIFFVVIFSGIALGAISSYLAVWRYLRK